MVYRTAYERLSAISVPCDRRLEQSRTDALFLNLNTRHGVDLSSLSLSHTHTQSVQDRNTPAYSIPIAHRLLQPSLLVTAVTLFQISQVWRVRASEVETTPARNRYQETYDDYHRSVDHGLGAGVTMGK